MAKDFQIVGKNTSAPFTLKVHRGEGMALLAMIWRKASPRTTSSVSSSNFGRRMAIASSR